MTLWWISRSTSLVALVLLTLTLALGVAAGSGRAQTRVVVQHVHRTASLLAVLLIAAHVATLVVDPHIDLGLVDVVVPFGSEFHRLATGLGTVALDLVIVVALTSALRTRLSGRAWRAVHYAAYALWPIAALHGLGAGTDVVLVRWLTIACAAVVGVAIAWRLLHTHSKRTSLLALAGLVVTGALAGLVVS